MFSVKEKVICVTGSRGLLGSKIINTLQEQGAIVIELDIDKDYKSDHYYLMNISNENEVIETVNKIYKKYNKIDGWINNAYPRTEDWGDKFEDVKYESWRQNIDMHLNGYFICCQTVLKIMKKQSFGSLINMSSIYGLVAPDFNIYENTDMTMPVAYSAIKGGINTLTRYLASYFGKYNIRVNSISPGGIFNGQPHDFLQKYINKVPSKRMGNESDITSAVVYLMSEDSSYINGHNLIIDGGWSII
jgi:NAD(P)-dependent dehydrogenase (short-subunit alcohol dehydrogenase family)